MRKELLTNFEAKNYLTKKEISDFQNFRNFRYRDNLIFHFKIKRRIYFCVSVFFRFWHNPFY